MPLGTHHGQFSCVQSLWRPTMLSRQPHSSLVAVMTKTRPSSSWGWSHSVTDPPEARCPLQRGQGAVWMECPATNAGATPQRAQASDHPAYRVLGWKPPYYDL